MKCKKCGVELLPTQKFCYNCGTANGNRQCSICGNIMENGYCIHCRRKQKSNYNCPQRYCIKCSKPVSGEDFLCEQCKAKKRTTSLWMRTIAAVLVVALLSGIAVHFVGNRMPKVKNAEQAISALNDLGEEWGYENAFSELTEKNTTTIDGDTYYRLQQNYKGIPVYGKTAVCYTDEKGKTLAVTGNLKDINSDIKLIAAALPKQIAQNIQCDSDKLQDKLTEDNMCIYTTDDGGVHLAYIINVDATEYIVDAQNGDLLFEKKTIIAADESIKGYTASDKSKANGFPVKNNGSYYVMVDESRELLVYTFDRNISYEEDDFLTQRASVVESTDNIFGNTEIEAKLEYEKGAQLLLNAVLIYDFYFDLGFESKLENTRLFYNDGWDNGENALGGTADDFGLVSMGYVTGVDNFDLVAHEYTHRVSYEIVDWIGDGENGALNEALSDIMGEMAEADCLNITPNWYNRYRDFINPAMFCNPSRYIDDPYWQDTSNLKKDNGGVHNNSTVISRAAYLMWNGIDGNTAKKIDLDTLAELWYRAMLLMPSDCNFVECRTLVELAASTMNLTDMQKQCVCEAFDTVGIPRASEEEYSELVHLVTDGETAVKGTVYEVKTVDGIETVVPVPKAMLTVYDEASSKVCKKLNMKNKDGFFEIELPAGTYSVSITAEGYIGQTITFELDGNEVRYLSIAMETVAEEPTETPVEFPHNNRTKRLSQVKVMNQGTLLETHVFQYDSNGRLIGTDITYNVPDSYTWEANCRYTYDSEGRLLEADRDDNWTYFGNERFEYDSNGNLLSYKWYWGGNGFDIPYSQIDYRYNSDGILIGETHYSLEYEDDEEYVKKDEEFSVDCTYDNQNKLISKRKTISWIDDDYDFKMTTSIGKHLRSELEFITEYSYNDDGLISREHSYYKHDGDASDGDIVIYQYDKKPFVVTMYEDDGMKIAINDISGNEIWSIIVDRVITDNDGYIVSASIGWEDEFITDYEFIYDDYDESEDGTSQAKNALAAYKPVAEKYNVSSEEQAFGWYSGILIDLDNDNVQELVMRYLSAPFEDAWWSEHKFSVYDYENGKVVTKLDGVTFGEIGGAGEDAYATILYKSGTPYVMTYNDFGETSSGGSMKPNRVGMMTIYDGKTCKEAGVYRIERWDNVMSYQIDQRTVSEKEFVSEIEQYQGVEVICDLYQLIEFPETFVTVSNLLQKMK